MSKDKICPKCGTDRYLITTSDCSDGVRSEVCQMHPILDLIDNPMTKTNDIEGADDETLLAWWVRKVPDSRKNEPLYGEILTLIKKQAKIDSLQSALNEVPKLEARIAVLEAAIVNVTNRVTKQTDVTESIIVRDAHPSNKMSDGSHVIETLNLHIRDAVDEARAALTNDIEGSMFIDLKTNDQN